MDMPLIGQGTWPLQGDECRRAVLEALEVGLRLIDTAQMYGNEAAVGAAVRESGLPRDEIFVTTKLHHDRFATGDVRESVEASVEKLGGPPDLLLIHWPPAGVETEAVIDALEELRAAGLTRAIGVSNFTPSMLRRAAARAPILTNQVEFHCLIDQSRLKAEADALGIRLTAYMPIARGKVFDLAPVRDAADRLGRTPAQIALRWIVQQGVTAIPMSTKRANMAANLAVLDFELPEADMAAITACTGANRRFCVPEWAPDWET
ncbi:MAG: aldo/keto reductase [Alphaproteobacteria bacterium]|nr:MAG: aldo/keto reductase [Alphaproteobacteria bacterium]